MKYLLKLHQTVESINISSSGISYKDLCLEAGIEVDNTNKCATKSLLQLWNYDENKIEQLNDELVLETVTKALADNSSGPLEEIQSILSGVEYDPETNQVLSAKGLMNIWFLKQNATKQEGQPPTPEVDHSEWSG